LEDFLPDPSHPLNPKSSKVVKVKIPMLGGYLILLITSSSQGLKKFTMKERTNGFDNFGGEKKSN
jgi:hypothetical protein